MAVTVEYVQAGGYAASQDRMGRGALLVKGTAATRVRAGIFPYNGSEGAVTAQATPNMTTSAAPVQIAIPDAGGGAYLFTSDTTATVTHAASNGTNGRIDLVIARVYDNEAGDAAPTQGLVLPGAAGTVQVQQLTGAVEVVTGVPSVTPAVPALPNSRCVVLKQVAVRAATSSVTTGDLSNGARPGFTTAIGGITPTAALTDLLALPASQQYDGQYADAGDTNQLLRSDGNAFAIVADPAAFTPKTAYTPTWTGTGGGSVSLGTGGSIVGWYKKIGFMVDWEITLVTGADASGPAGQYWFSLPPFLANCRTNRLTPIGISTFFGGNHLVGACNADPASSGTANGASKFQVSYSGQAGSAASGNPASWGARVVVFGGRYESLT